MKQCYEFLIIMTFQFGEFLMSSKRPFGLLTAVSVTLSRIKAEALEKQPLKPQKAPPKTQEVYAISALCLSVAAFTSSLLAQQGRILHMWSNKYVFIALFFHFKCNLFYL